MREKEKFKLYALDELFDSELYVRLAAQERNEANKKLLEELARVERSHYEFWVNIAGEKVELGPWERLKLAALLAAARVMGKTFIIKLLEGREASTVEEYERAASSLKGEPLDGLKTIIEDERRHELEFANQIDEVIVRQLGSIALGISDAIIELTGVLLGFAGYAASSTQVAVAGLIVGVSAALSMAAAAYAQARHEKGKSPALSATFTGTFYLLTVLLLVAPLFLGLRVQAAVAVSMLTALALLSVLSLYGSVLLERSFVREFLESALVVLAVAFIGYAIGAAAREFIGVVEQRLTKLLPPPR